MRLTVSAQCAGISPDAYPAQRNVRVELLMPPRLLFASLVALCLLPWILISILMDMTRRRAIGLLALGAGLGAITYGTSLPAALPARVWLTEPRHLALLIACTALVGCAAAASFAIRRRKRRSELDWKTAPSQREFAVSCIGFLSRHDWTHHKEGSTAFVTACLMRKATRLVTFVLLVEAKPIDEIRRTLQDLRWRTGGRFVIVTWRQPTAAFRNAVARTGWRSVHITELQQFDPSSDVPSAVPEVYEGNTAWEQLIHPQLEKVRHVVSSRSVASEDGQLSDERVGPDRIGSGV